MRRPSFLLAFTLSIGLVLFGCDGTLDTPGAEGPHPDSHGLVPGQASIVEVIGKHDDDVPSDYTFELSSTEIPYGWTTFDFHNHSGATHFTYVVRVPDVAVGLALDANMSVRDYWYQEVTVPFQEAWDPFFAGEITEGVFIANLFAALPEWLGLAPPVGGAGFTSGHHSSRTTVYLEEGTYIVECYVKNLDGEFHSYLGMIEELVVTDTPSGAPEPRPSMEISLSAGEITVDENLRPGNHTVAVHFTDVINPFFYGHFLWHDVHLIRLDDGTTVSDVNDWMSWLDLDGLVSSSAEPGPQTFLGGVQSIAMPGTAYYHINLRPGEYAWVAEVPEPMSAHEMLVPFTVPFGQATGRR